MILSKPGWMIYKEQMDPLHYGDALWEPAPNHDYERVRIGDVGYIRRGRFHLLFSAGRPLGSRRLGIDVPSTFEPLFVGPITFGDPRLPGCLGTSTNEETKAMVGTSNSRNQPVKPGSNFSFELIQEQGAALITKYSTFREDTELETAFEDYTKRHYNSWVTFARYKRCGNDVKPILVSGVDLTKDFAMMAYSNNGAGRSCQFVVSGPIAGSSSESVWGKWKTRGVHTNCGPRRSQREAFERELPDVDTRETPENYNQCVFVRYYTMRFREPVFPKLVKAGASPRSRSPGDYQDKGKTLPELTTWLDLDSDTDEVGDFASVHSSPAASYDSELGAFRDVPSEETDVFDVIAEYVLNNSEAEAVLIHHRDVAQLRGVIPRMSMLEVLSERQPVVQVDGSGVGRVAHRSQERLEISRPSSVAGTIGHASDPGPKPYTPTRPPTWEVTSPHTPSSKIRASGDPQGIRLPPPPATRSTPTPKSIHQARPLPSAPVPHVQPPVLQLGHPLSTTEDVVPIRPPSMSARRSNSSPAMSPNAPPPPPSTSSPRRSSTDPAQRYEPTIKRAPANEEEALALAIALSEKESKEQAGKAIQEEEDVTKAIEESLRCASSFGMPVSSSNAGSSTFPGTISSPHRLPVSESSVSPRISRAFSHTSHTASLPTSKVLSPLVLPEKPGVGNGKAPIRWLSEEEEESVVATGPSDPKPASVLVPSPKPETITPPASVPSMASRKRREAQQHRFSVTNADPESPLPLYYPPAPTNTSVPAKTFPRLPPYDGTLVEKPRAGRSQSWDRNYPTSSSAGPISTNQSSYPPVQYPDSPLALSPTLLTSAEPVTAHAFLDQQLLNGVSLGFGPPLISNIKTTLKGGVPNVIPLPAGRYMPFHIQAPDWRHLLKMMARLSGSKIEASDEALATLGQELKLRTVVQFIKVTPASQDWRTVIYLTIDKPPPATASRKFTNGDVNALPYSYTMGSLPHLLQDGPNSQMSKYYTIPATPNVPYPTLPISFPNMAGYLASAVDDSRRMLHDNTSGMKRLVKTLDILYPGKVELGMEDDGPDRPFGGVMNAFRNVLGKGRRGQQRSSDDYADLVTPFVPEWG